KTVDQLTVEDIKTFPVWEYTNANEMLMDETVVRPVPSLPVDHLTGRIVGTEVRLANGTSVWSTLSNIRVDNPRLTKHALTLAVFSGLRCFVMSRYYDVDYAQQGPYALAAFLGLRVDDVFPIAYDISKYCRRASPALQGVVEKEPREKLSTDEIIKLA